MVVGSTCRNFMEACQFWQASPLDYDTHARSVGSLSVGRTERPRAGAARRPVARLAGNAARARVLAGLLAGRRRRGWRTSAGRRRTVGPGRTNARSDCGEPSDEDTSQSSRGRSGLRSARRNAELEPGRLDRRGRRVSGDQHVVSARLASESRRGPPQRLCRQSAAVEHDAGELFRTTRASFSRRSLATKTPASSPFICSKRTTPASDELARLLVCRSSPLADDIAEKRVFIRVPTMCELEAATGEGTLHVEAVDGRQLCVSDGIRRGGSVLRAFATKDRATRPCSPMRRAIN